MSFYVPGNKVINSTLLGSQSNPSTSAILAELDSTNFGSSAANRKYVINCWLGGSSVGSWVVELASSPNVDSTSILDQMVIYTAPGQTSQFVYRCSVTDRQRVRVRHFSSNTGSYAAKLQAEELD